MSQQNVIEGFEQLSIQQMFDIAVKHIGSTGVASINSIGQCQYSGTGCNAAPFMVGWFREVADNLDASGWEYLVNAGKVPSHNAGFIKQLQLAHDSAAFAQTDMNEDFKKVYTHEMRAVAKRNNLSTAELDALGWG